MANTGNFIYNQLAWEEPKGSPVSGSPFTIPLDATAEDIVEIVGNNMTIDIAQSFINSRLVLNSPACLPSCLTNLIADEYPAEIVLNNNVGESFHAIVNQIEVCVTEIQQL